MRVGEFEANRRELEHQFDRVNWITKDEVDAATLKGEYEAILQAMGDQPKALIKARTFELILTKAPIAIVEKDIFQNMVYAGTIMRKQRSSWEKNIQREYLADELSEIQSGQECGAYQSGSDFGHTSPNTRLLIEVGFAGLLERVECASAKENLTDDQKRFYRSCKIALEAIPVFLNRMADAIEPYNTENSRALRNLAVRAPGNIYEAMQLLIVYFFLHEFVAGTRVRTLGRLDVLLSPFYEEDIKNGTFSQNEIKEMLKYFLNKFWAAKVPFDLPFALGGGDAEGNEVTGEISYLIVDTYNELNIHSPKIHIRVSDKTPAEFIKRVLRYIRGGNSSFVFVNDAIGIKALVDVGIEEKEARDYVPIGCYEPAVWGVEIGCTGNGGVNLAKAVELTFTDGRDLKTGKLIGVRSGEINTYSAFVDAVKRQINYMTEKAMGYICKIEGHYGEINPDPILSSMYTHSIETGRDVYEGGAKYNNSSLSFYGIASLVDALAAVEALVFDKKLITLEELGTVLRDNWEGHERLRLIAKNLPEKYGNGSKRADAICREISDYIAGLVNNHANGRGGVFKAALFSIDYCFSLGEKTMATPDGRYAGEPLSKNLCASAAMDRNGITALINSVTQIDHTKFPNGSVLDIVLHPSAVSGEDGLDAFYGILKTYFEKGGFAMHGNVFDASELKKAQEHPEKYATLQVRVCGWNAYFVNLSKVEQDTFIRQAENAQ